MSFEGLQERLTALQETTSQLKELIDRLHNLTFQPGSVPLGGLDDDNVGTELSAEISQILREEEDELELLQEEVEDIRSGRPGSETEHTKTRLKDGLERLQQELKSSRLNFRKAQIVAKRNLTRAQRLERELLLQSYSQPVSEATSPRLGAEDAESIKAPSIRHHRQAHHAHQQQSTLSEEDQQTVGAASNVTSSLRRTHDLIAAELARSEFAHQTLTESSAALAQLDESYGSLEGMLASSKDLLGTLVKSQKSDTWYLQTAMYMLLSTGAWLVFRRFLYGPAWWLVWLPIRMLYSLVMGGGGAVITYGSSSGSSTVVVDQATVEVQGLPDSDLPTIDVGTAKAESTVVVKGDVEGLGEKIGKMVEDMPELQTDDGLEDGEEADEFHDAVQEPVEVPQPRDEL
ncbi:hypothetical protein HYQ44_003667 [Verticillium longisporum]|nr:hypothetical protein HYQ44_003667 [Verticillium longisporum]